MLVPGLDPGIGPSIHVFLHFIKDMDFLRGHDEAETGL